MVKLLLNTLFLIKQKVAKVCYCGYNSTNTWDMVDGDDENTARLFFWAS